MSMRNLVQNQSDYGYKTRTLSKSGIYLFLVLFYMTEQQSTFGTQYKL